MNPKKSEYVNQPDGCQPGYRTRVDSWLDRLFPQSCVVCGLSADHGPICRVCDRHAPRLGHACRMCALPLADTADRLCGACLARPPPYDHAFAAMRFADPARQLVHRFKFHCDTACGRVLGNWMCDVLRRAQADCRPLPDVWVPVPMHRWRLCARLINPARELARDLSRCSGRPLLDNRLRRRRRTRPQTGLSARDRRRNLRGAFRWHGNDLGGLRVGLVDDVMTTGSTVSECTRMLAGARAGKISIWVAARALSP